jgi:chemotaxis response regulator CheB
MSAVLAAGGSTIAQSPESCVVDSMPRTAIERGFAQRVVNLPNLASILQTKCVPDQPQSDSFSDAPTEIISTDSGFRRRSS